MDMPDAFEPLEGGVNLGCNRDGQPYILVGVEVMVHCAPHCTKSAINTAQHGAQGRPCLCRVKRHAASSSGMAEAAKRRTRSKAAGVVAPARWWQRER